MRFWSKGLGKRCLAMDCGTESMSVEGPAMVLAGKVRPPLGWAYTITMNADDWTDFVELTFHPTLVRYLTRRKRIGLAARLAGHLARFYFAYAMRLGMVWARRLGGARPADSPARS